MDASGHRDALDRLLEAGRRHSTAVVLFHSAIAAAAGLSTTESKALEIIDRRGPLTHAELVRELGLAPASVTGILGRLESKGAARRSAHPNDARRILIEAVPEFTQASLARFGGFLDGMTEIASYFTDDELTTIVRFLDTVAAMQATEAEHIRSASLQP